MKSSHHGTYVRGNTHPTMANNNELRDCKVKLISEISPQFGLRAATRPHEVGIGSNRKPAGCGEYVLESCTHCPSDQQSRGYLKLAVWQIRVNSAMGVKSLIIKMLRLSTVTSKTNLAVSVKPNCFSGIIRIELY